MPKKTSPAGKLIEAFAEVDIEGAETLVNVARALLKEKKRAIDDLRQAMIRKQEELDGIKKQTEEK